MSCIYVIIKIYCTCMWLFFFLQSLDSSFVWPWVSAAECPGDVGRPLCWRTITWTHGLHLRGYAHAHQGSLWVDSSSSRNSKIFPLTHSPFLSLSLSLSLSSFPSLSLRSNRGWLCCMHAASDALSSSLRGQLSRPESTSPPKSCECDNNDSWST